MWKWLWLGIMYRIWMNFDACDRKSLHCLEETIGRNMDIKVTAVEGSKGGEEDSRGSFYHLREHVYHHEQNTNRNMNIKGASGEISDENKEHVIGNWRNLLYSARNLTELCSTVVWKVELVGNELGYLAESFTSKILKVWPGFILLLIVKGEKNETY